MASASTERGALKAHLSFGVLPRNFQRVGTGFTRTHLQSLQLILLHFSSLAIDPGGMNKNGGLSWRNPFDSFEPDVRLRRATSGRVFVFQKHSENFN